MSADSTFRTRYRIVADSRQEAEKRAAAIALEQTSEMPSDAIPPHLKGRFTGEVATLAPIDGYHYEAEIRYPLSATGTELHQCLNILFGNSSLQSGILLTGVEWHALTEIFPGPAHGIHGLRNRLGVTGRPISCSALKPIGLTPEELAERFYRLALGGMDLIKDDHGLANQPSAPFHLRLNACLEAAARAADKTGRRTGYLPNITGDGYEPVIRYDQAREAGADGVLLSPQLTGWSMIRTLIERDGSLPIMAHPAFTGSWLHNPDHGMSAGFLYGELWRALGADAVVYPNSGGRFSFSETDCLSINQNLRSTDSPFRAAFPVPGGGIQRETVGKWTRVYGPDTIFLVGGSLYQHPDGLETAAREFQQQLDRYGDHT